MTSIRIIDIPAGEAPEKIRKAWVGLVLPLVEGKCGKRNRWISFGVLSVPRSLLGQLWGVIRHKHNIRDGYMVDARTAVEILENENQTAARWWHENTPHMFKANMKFIFEAEVCEELL